MAWPHWNELLNGDARGVSAEDVAAWWTARWLRFNLLMGIVGFTTWLLVFIAGSAAVKPGVDFEEPLAMILGPPVYAVLANICYLLGPIINTFDKSRKPKKGLFRLGLYFSLALTALPGVWAVVAWIGTLITGRKLD